MEASPEPTSSEEPAVGIFGWLRCGVGWSNSCWGSHITPAAWSLKWLLKQPHWDLVVPSSRNSFHAPRAPCCARDNEDSPSEVTWTGALSHITISSLTRRIGLISALWWTNYVASVDLYMILMSMICLSHAHPLIYFPCSKDRIIGNNFKGSVVAALVELYLSTGAFLPKVDLFLNHPP